MWSIAALWATRAIHVPNGASPLVALKPHGKPGEDGLRHVLGGVLVAEHRAHVGEHGGRIAQVEEAQGPLVAGARPVRGPAHQLLAGVAAGPPAKAARADGLEAVGGQADRLVDPGVAAHPCTRLRSLPSRRALKRPDVRRGG